MSDESDEKLPYATFAERYGAAAEAARQVRLAAQDAAWVHPVLYSWELHVLTSLVRSPQALRLFLDRLRPGVLELAQAICVVAKDETQYFDHFLPRELAAARAFIAGATP